LQQTGRDGPRPHRLARTRIAITQAHYHPDARAYLQRRKEAGDTSTEAIRALRRRLSDLVYRALLDDALIGTHQDSLRQAA
jgi:transposase